MKFPQSNFLALILQLLSVISLTGNLLKNWYPCKVGLKSNVRSDFELLFRCLCNKKYCEWIVTCL